MYNIMDYTYMLCTVLIHSAERGVSFFVSLWTELQQTRETYNFLHQIDSLKLGAQIHWTCNTPSCLYRFSLLRIVVKCCMVHYVTK